MSEAENTDGNEGDEGSEEFDFYLGFTKTLVLDLPSVDDRSIAAAWVQKIEGEERPKERLNYLKLLLFVLQRGRLCGIFKKQPPAGPLQPFPQGIGIIEMGSLMLDQDDGGGGDARSLPYDIELSNDMREFVASQEVPNFGIQMYYAWSSDEPIYEWTAFDDSKVPKVILEKIKHLKEIKAEEESPAPCGALKKKKFFSTTLEGASKIIVKSPQEIEKSQGRSFHTYVGLVGQMGNFGKCDGDPERFQRQESKEKCPPPARGGGRRPQRNGGESDCEDSGVSANSINRPCLCPYPCHHQECPDSRQQRPPANDQFGFGGRGGCNGNSFPGQASAHMNHRRAEGCPEADQPRMAAQRCPPTRERPRSSSGNRCPPLDCSSDDSGRSRPSGGACICSSPPCMCPCPRKPQSAGGSPAQPRRPSPGSVPCAPPPSPRVAPGPSQQCLSGEYNMPSYSQRPPALGDAVRARLGGCSAFVSPEPGYHAPPQADPCATQVIKRNRCPPDEATGPRNNCNPCNPEGSFAARRQLFAPGGVSTPSETGPCSGFPVDDFYSTIPNEGLCDSGSSASPELMHHPVCDDTPPNTMDCTLYQPPGGSRQQQSGQYTSCESGSSGSSQNNTFMNHSPCSPHPTQRGPQYLSESVIYLNQDSSCQDSQQSDSTPCEAEFHSFAPQDSSCGSAGHSGASSQDPRESCPEYRDTGCRNWVEPRVSRPVPDFPGMNPETRALYANPPARMVPILDRLASMRQRSLNDSRRDQSSCPQEGASGAASFEPPCDPCQQSGAGRPRAAPAAYNNGCQQPPDPCQPPGGGRPRGPPVAFDNGCQQPPDPCQRPGGGRPRGAQVAFDNGCQQPPDPCQPSGAGRPRAAPAPYNDGCQQPPDPCQPPGGGRPRGPPVPFDNGCQQPPDPCQPSGGGRPRGPPVPFDDGCQQSPDSCQPSTSARPRAPQAPYNDGCQQSPDPCQPSTSARPRAAPAPYNNGCQQSPDPCQPSTSARPRAAPAPYNNGCYQPDPCQPSGAGRRTGCPPTQRSIRFAPSSHYNAPSQSNRNDCFGPSAASRDPRSQQYRPSNGNYDNYFPQSPDDTGMATCNTSPDSTSQRYFDSNDSSDSGMNQSGWC